MARVALFVANGTEEVEALTVVDILRRVEIVCDIVSILEVNEVTSSHGITFKTDKVIGEIDYNDYDMLILPGGMPGTINLKNVEELSEQLKIFAETKAVAAICAAPTILSGLGILKGKKATCNKGFQDVLAFDGADVDSDAKVVTTDNIITSQALGTAVPFGLAIVEYFLGKEAADELEEKIAY